MDISVLIATFGRPHLLGETLRSLAVMETDPLRWELIVIDNAGDEATARVVREAGAGLPVQFLVEPRAGKNRALNRGLDHVSGALIAFTDDDVVVDRHWLRELWEGAHRWPAATMFGGRVLPRWPPEHPEPRPHPFFVHAYAIADFDHPEGRYSSGYVFGPNMALCREVFDSGRRFDPSIGPDGTGHYIPGSETSLTVALEHEGHQAVYLPRALVHHQIRPEQLHRRWLYRRAFRLGRGQALKRGLAGGLGALPRDIVNAMGREYRALWRCRLRGDREGALDHGIAYWMARGMAYHCRVTRRPDQS